MSQLPPPAPPPPPSSNVAFWTPGKIIGFSVGGGLLLILLIVMIVVLASSGPSAKDLASAPGKAKRPEVAAYLRAVEDVCKEGRKLAAKATTVKSRTAYSKEMAAFGNVLDRVPPPPETWEDVHRNVKALVRAFEEIEEDMARLERESNPGLRRDMLRRLDARADYQQAAIERIEAAIR